MARSGDGCTKYSKANPEDLQAGATESQEDSAHENLIWGWDDADFKEDEKQCATILNKVE